MSTAASERAGRSTAARSVVVLFATIALLVFPAASPDAVDAAGLKDQISAARDRQQSLNKSIGRQEALLKGLRQDQDATRSALRDTASALDEINVDQKKVKRRIVRAQAALDRAVARHAVLVDDLRQTDFTLGLLDQELASGEKDLKARRQSLGQRLAEAYRAENTTLLEQVFTAESFSDALSDASAYLSFGDQDAQLVERIATDQQALDTLRLLTTSTRLRTDQLRRDTLEVQGEIRARKAELNEARRRLNKLETRTKRLQERQEERLKKLKWDAAKVKAYVARQERAQRTLQRRIAGLVRQAQAQASRRSSGLGSSGSGRFIWPTTGTVTQGYGCTGFSLAPRRGSCSGFHDGIDIANAAGTPIRAAGDGVVAFIGFRPDGAFVVVMGHAGGYETVYAHMQPTYPVRVGQFVKKGTLIGRMGSTGLSTGSHLHWEVSKGFSTVSPYSVT